MQAILTTAALLAQGRTRLAGEPGAVLDAELLLSRVLGVPRARLRSHPEEPCSAEQQGRYLASIERRAAGEPLAYIVGHRDFWTLRLAVSPAVLVPRPETELVVERALTLLTRAAASVADLGTGSGAIALALARERPDWRVVATDRDPLALEMARRNAAALGIGNIEFLQGAWFAPLAGRRFDLIASNPPYVAGDDPRLDAPALRYEPAGALTPGQDALTALREIIEGAPAHLVPGGFLVLEHGSDQAADVARVLVTRGFAHVRSHRDLAGHERVTESSWG